MDAKSHAVLELPRVLDRLAGFAAFSAGRDLALQLEPATELAEAQRRQQITSEARRLLSANTNANIGGARDVREAVGRAARAMLLQPAELLDIKNTLIAGRELQRVITRLRETFPRLAFIADGISETPGLVEAVSRALDERGEVLDSASDRLAQIRRDLSIAHDRLLDKLQNIVSSQRNAPYLQEPIVTQRGDRYVIPLKANFKGRIRGVVHDQSSSGATLFIEPLATVELNNRWRELQLAEAEEVRRILAELTAMVGVHAESITYTVAALAELDLAFAKARYAESLRASEPELLAFYEKPPESVRPGHQVGPTSRSTLAHSPVRDGAGSAPPRPGAASSSRRDWGATGGRGAHPGSVLRLHGARHPLLDPETVVPVDLVLDDKTYIVVITGPNTGGKTVTLKTAGLLVLMAECGLHLPVQAGSALTVFAGVYADIGDEQSIEQSLSTFSSHITNIIRILGQADEHSLVVLDELGAGTDPGEGSALARALLSYLLDRGVTTLTATHYPELKAYAHATPGMINASVEFDTESLAPTYRLTMGLPGRSNALSIARQLGLDETIVAEARGMTGATDQQTQDLLDEIHRQHDLAQKERALAEAVRADALRWEADLTRRLEKIETERQEILDSVRADAQRELDDLRAEVEDLRKELRSARLPLQALRDVEDQAGELEASFGAELAAPPAGALPDAPPTEPGPLRLGDRVHVSRLGAQGVIMALSESEAEVQIGRMRLRAQLDELVRLGQSAPDRAEDAPDIDRPFAPSPGMELHLRGKRIADGLDELERYLDAAALAGLPWVRIVHGKGTGQMRKAVRDALRSHELVQSFEPGKHGEGGEGVTVAKLVSLE